MTVRVSGQVDNFLTIMPRGGRMTVRVSGQVDNFLAIMPRGGRMTVRVLSCSGLTRTSIIRQ